jgi:magnesium transporter
MIKVLAHLGTDQVEFLDPAELPHLLADPETLTWVDLESPDELEAHVILADTFHFHPLTVEDCCNDITDPPKIDDYRDYLFIIAQAIDFSVLEDSIVTTEVNIFLGKNYVVTVHRRPLPVLGEVVDHCKRQLPHVGTGADWLCHAILDKLVDQLLPVVEAIDEEIASLEDQALESADRAVVARMGQLKRSTLRLRWLVAPQRDVVSRIGRGDFPNLIRDETHMYFRDVHDHLVRMDVTIENLRDLGESVMAVYLATQGNRLNEVMKALGIVGVIFLPLTLISGVFGTNFTDTYMDSGWLGFGIMCGSFTLIAFVMLAIFRMRRWL